jgi:hypothetical protein
MDAAEIAVDGVEIVTAAAEIVVHVDRGVVIPDLVAAMPNEIRLDRTGIVANRPQGVGGLGCGCVEGCLV